jgi:hypothetical protein
LNREIRVNLAIAFLGFLLLFFGHVILVSLLCHAVIVGIAAFQQPPTAWHLIAEILQTLVQVNVAFDSHRVWLLG